jgi:hypothetical protein
MIGLLASLLSLASQASAQALPAASVNRFQPGFELSYARPDFWVAPIGDPQYSRQYLLGVTAFGDFAFNTRVGVEGEFHCLCLITSLDRAELTYLIGPRISFPRGRFSVYIKGMAGISDLFVQEWQDNIGIPRGSGLAYTGGVGLDYRYSYKVTLRFFDVEAQRWPSYSNNGINPIVISSGFTYRFH